MYYFEKDYIMRLIHGIARILARMMLGRELDAEGEAILLREKATRDHYDFLRAMIDAGQVNEAEEQLFDLLETCGWDDREKASLVIAFYEDLNEKEDAFLEAADFSREEIIRGMEDALKICNMEIPEYLRIG